VSKEFVTGTGFLSGFPDRSCEIRFEVGKIVVSFYEKCGKRCFDLIVSLLAVLVLSPLLVIVYLMIRVGSRDSAFFCQERMGKKGKLFQMIKFRTMSQDKAEERFQFTPGNRQRVTRMGKLLRKTKLDELPALINVIRGEMSLVGPRPEVPKYTKLYQRENLKVLSMRPGITDSASIKYRHEEEMLAKRESPVRFYEEEILPDKLRLGLDYVNSISFLGDVRIILGTLKAIFSRK
jgi:lipopolysaccharide/colanic/teichoic acid biosynthesis glycosyltransferase